MRWLCSCAALILPLTCVSAYGQTVVPPPASSGGTGTSLPTATGAGQVPVSSGAGTTYTSRALTSSDVFPAAIVNIDGDATTSKTSGFGQNNFAPGLNLYTSTNAGYSFGIIAGRDSANKAWDYEFLPNTSGGFQWCTFGAGFAIATPSQFTFCINLPTPTANGTVATLSMAGQLPLTALGSGTASAGKYVDGGTGAWTALPVSSGNATVAAVATSATPSVTLASNTIYTITLATNSAPTFTGYTAGLQNMTFVICQPASGGPYTWTYPGAVVGGIPSSSFGSMAAGSCYVQRFIEASATKVAATGPGVMTSVPVL